MSQWRYNTTKHQIILCLLLGCALCLNYLFRAWRASHCWTKAKVVQLCAPQCVALLLGRSYSNQSNGRTCMSLAHVPFCVTKHRFIQDCDITIWRCSWWRCRRARNEASTGCCEGCIDFFAQRKNKRRHGKVTNFQSLTSWNTEPILPIRRLRRAVCLAWQLLNLNTSDLDIIGITITGIRSNDQSTQSHHRSRHHGSYPGSRSHLQAADLDETDEFCCEDLSIWCT